jgi:hypothetical protein
MGVLGVEPGSGYSPKNLVFPAFSSIARCPSILVFASVQLSTKGPGAG